MVEEAYFSAIIILPLVKFSKSDKCEYQSAEPINNSIDTVTVPLSQNLVKCSVAYWRQSITET